MKKGTAIHILGASGAGTTSVGRYLSEVSGIQHFDTDRFYWLDTSEPFSCPRPESDRIKILLEALPESESWVLSGSLCGWGDFLIPRFDLVIWLTVDYDLRMERLKEREFRRYGQLLSTNDKMINKSQTFLNWAGAYDTSAEVSRNAQRHAEWLGKVDCPVYIVLNNGILKGTVDKINSIIESEFI